MQTKQQKTERQLQRAKRRRKRRIKRIAWRSTLSLLTAIALILIAALVAGYVAFKGPSQHIGDLLTKSMLETSALKFVPRIYYNEEEMQAILDRNQVVETDEVTDTSMIVIAPPTPEPTPVPETPVEFEFDIPEPTPVPEDLLVADDGIEVYAVKGTTYNGFMMVVHDPSRVSVGTCRDYFTSERGLELKDIAKRYNATAAINGGGFEDPSGMGNGGQPVGLVISHGEMLRGTSGREDNDIAIGFTQDNVLLVGRITGARAMELGIRDALMFGPALVVNGEPTGVKGNSSGLNPRTAIGQRADGAVLMLVIDGRSASSLGATLSDLINIMMEYGAVNAANLDGGSSSLMYYNGAYLNNGVVLTGSRTMPTAFIVR